MPGLKENNPLWTEDNKLTDSGHLNFLSYFCNCKSQAISTSVLQKSRQLVFSN